jgi:hypothetical protein
MNTAECLPNWGVATRPLRDAAAELAPEGSGSTARAARGQAATGVMARADLRKVIRACAFARKATLDLD